MWHSKYRRTIVTILIAIIVIGATSIYYLVVSPPRTPAAVFRYTETIIIKNNGTEPIEFGGVSTETFLDFGWQKPHILQVSSEYKSQVDQNNYTVSSDKDGNPILIINGPKLLKPGENFSVTIAYEIESFSRKIPNIDTIKSGNLDDIPQSFVNYTKEVAPWRNPEDIRLDTPYWNGTKYYNMTLQMVAENLTGGSENVLQILLNDVKWIATYIDYPTHHQDPSYPIETARNHTGDCDDQSNLLISLLRYQDIPAFLMMGQLYLGWSDYANVTGIAMNGHLFYESHYTAGHAWAMVYIPPWNWVPCDPVAVFSSPKEAIIRAAAFSPISLVFKNVTGIYEEAAADYIGSSREETRIAEEKDIYYWLKMDMEQVLIPGHVALFRSPIFILYAEIIGFGALIFIVGIHDKRKVSAVSTFKTHLVKWCTRCGAENPVEAVYCGRCGYRMKREETFNRT